MLGGTIAFQDVRRNEALLDLVERYGATLLYGPPATLINVSESQRAQRRDVSTLRHVVIGSAPVLQQLVDELRETLGARTYSLWGMSENGPVTITRPEEPDGWAAQSNGRPIDAMEIRIDPSGIEGESDYVGRLRVRGASLSLGYYKRDDVYAAEFSTDGWFDTGDLARDDGRGGIRILGRARDTILRDGLISRVPAWLPAITAATACAPAVGSSPSQSLSRIMWRRADRSPSPPASTTEGLLTLKPVARHRYAIGLNLMPPHSAGQYSWGGGRAG
jgi:cyclohexanecarboxylate-CoA ligase